MLLRDIEGIDDMAGIAATGADSKELERLLVRMSKRDEPAFKQLYAATRRKLFSTALQLVKRRYLAEEVLQETYVRIWLNAGSYRPSSSTPMAWMMTIARNLAIDVARKSGREVQSDDSILMGFPTTVLPPSKRSKFVRNRTRPSRVDRAFLSRCKRSIRPNAISSCWPISTEKVETGSPNAMAYRSTPSRPGFDVR